MTTNDACCLEGELYDNTLKMCIAMNELPNTVGCKKYSDGKCLECYADNELHLIPDG